jgi:hypothetical protein
VQLGAHVELAARQSVRILVGHDAGVEDVISSDPWPPERLADVRDHVVVLAAEAEDQRAWLDAPPIVYPVNELGNGLWDKWPAWSGGLLRSDLLTKEGADALDALSEFLLALDAESWTDDAATLRLPEWAEARRQARRVLELIDSVSP